LNQPKGHDNAIKTVSRGLNSKTTKNLSWPTKDSKLQNSEYEEYQVGAKEVESQNFTFYSYTEKTFHSQHVF
jgi:hypothetical protein